MINLTIVIVSHIKAVIFFIERSKKCVGFGRFDMFRTSASVMAVLVLGPCSSINFFHRLEFVLNLSFYPLSLKLSLPIHGYEVGCCDSTVDSYKTNGYYLLVGFFDMELADVVLLLLLIPARFSGGHIW